MPRNDSRRVKKSLGEKVRKSVEAKAAAKKPKKPVERRKSKKTGLDLPVAHKELLFINEYLIDYNASRAAKAAGYSSSSAGTKLLSKPLVKSIIAAKERSIQKKHELTRDQILEQLFFAATRSAADFCDAEGKIITNIHLLSERAQNTIDGIEQTVSYDKGGNEIVRTKLKLVPKATAIDLAMKHKGLFAAAKFEGEVKHTLNWENMTKAPDTDSTDEIESIISNPLLLPAPSQPIPTSFFEEGEEVIDGEIVEKNR